MIDFKKRTLLAIAVGGLISPTAFAAILDDEGTGPSETFFYSDEYLSTADADDTVTAGALAVTIEAEYAIGDIVTLDVSGSAVVSGFPTSVSVVCADNTNAGITFGRLSSDADGAVYRVTEIDSGTCVNAITTVGITVPFAPALQLNAQAVDAANTITANFSAETGTGLALDTAGGADRSGALVVTGSQYKATVTTPFDGVIDVEDDRETFEGGVSSDQMFWDVDAANVPTIPGGSDGGTSATPVAPFQEVTITGPFGFLVDTNSTAAGVQPAGGVVASSCAVDVAGGAITGTTIAATCGNGLNDVNIDNANNLTVPGGAGVAIDDGAFSSTHVFTFNGIGVIKNTITVVNVSLGKWVLNGFQAKVAYMPFQTGIGQVIYLANRGTQTGAITVEWIDQNGNSGSFGIGNIAAGSTRAIGPAIQAGLPAAQQEGGRLALTIIANVPACDAQLNAQYNVSGDRAFSVATNNCSE